MEGKGERRKRRGKREDRKKGSRGERGGRGRYKGEEDKGGEEKGR